MLWSFGWGNKYRGPKPAFWCGTLKYSCIFTAQWPWVPSICLDVQPFTGNGQWVEYFQKKIPKGTKTNLKKNFDNNIKRVIDLCKKTDPLPCSLKWGYGCYRLRQNWSWISYQVHFFLCQRQKLKAAFNLKCT